MSITADAVIEHASPPEIFVEKLAHFDGLPLPKYETRQSAGMDLRAALTEDVCVRPGQRILVRTGLKIALPQGYEAQIRPRSGLAFKHGITVVNAPGTVDSDYRGEIMIALVNISDTPFDIERGMRVAQMVISPVVQAQLKLADTLPDSDRGQGGFGSTGLG